MLALALASGGRTFTNMMDAGDEVDLDASATSNEPTTSALDEPAHEVPRTDRAEEAQLVVLEVGKIRFFARPKVDVRTPRSIGDVQRFSFTLAPRNRTLARRIAVGKKRMPDARVRERQWAWVERVGPAADITADLGATTYTTKTRGVRRQSEAVEVAHGTYAITSHRDHAHLLYELDPEQGPDTSTLRRQLHIVPRASYVAAVFNPDRARYRPRARARDVGSRKRPAEEERAEVRATEPTEEEPPFGEPSLYDDQLTDRFGKRRFAPLEPALLDHEGAELVLIGGGASPVAESAVESVRPRGSRREEEWARSLSFPNRR